MHYAQGNIRVKWKFSLVSRYEYERLDEEIMGVYGIITKTCFTIMTKYLGLRVSSSKLASGQRRLFQNGENRF